VTGTRAIGFKKGLVVVQVTLSLLLLIGSGLFIRTLRNLKSVDPGFKTSNLVSFAMNPALSGYDAQKTRDFYRNLESTLGSLPGVHSVGLARMRLLDGDRSSSTVTVEGYRSNDGEDMEPWVNTISPRFFATLGIPLVAGREFRNGDERPLIPQSFVETLDFYKESDRERYREMERQLGGPPKYAVVNERFARHYFGAANAVGRRFGFGGNPGTRTDIEIIGVVRDSMYSTLREQIPRQVFMPYLQGNATGMHVYVRTSLEPEQMFNAIRRTVTQMDSTLPVYDMRAMVEQIDRSLVTERMIAMLSTVFGLIATVLATVGLYGVMAYTVARKTREIGIRMALGAFATDVIWMVMREVLTLIGIGVAIGMVSAVLLTRYIEAQLFGLTPNDPRTLGIAAAVLIAVAALAGYFPAMRASRVNPIRALRYE
jgi:predicted permease